MAFVKQSFLQRENVITRQYANDGAIRSAVLPNGSFRLNRGVSPPIRPTYLAHVLNPARIKQIWDMYYERPLLPNDFGQRSLCDAAHFDAGTTWKCSSAGRAYGDCHKWLPQSIRAVHRVMR